MEGKNININISNGEKEKVINAFAKKFILFSLLGFVFYFVMCSVLAMVNINRVYTRTYFVFFLDSVIRQFEEKGKYVFEMNKPFTGLSNKKNV